MKTARAIAVVMLAFLFGGSSAEVAVQTHRALHRQKGSAGEGGDLVAFELRGESGEVIARPRLIAPPGRAAHLILRDPSDPRRVRLTLRVETTREPTGEVSVDYEVSLPFEAVSAAGRVSVTQGVELALDLGVLPLSATLLTVPVPSAAFDAFLESERRIRHT